MELTIWKYQLTTGTQTIEMPKNAQILTVQTQNGSPFMWALVAPSAVKESRVFRVYGTGHTIKHDTPKNYIATFQLDSGALVFHVFEEIKV